MGASDEPILLYEGDLTLEVGEETWSGAGSVSWKWVPVQGVEILIPLIKGLEEQSQILRGLYSPEPFTVQIATVESAISTRLIGSAYGATSEGPDGRVSLYKVRMRPMSTVVQGNPSALAHSARVHIVNFANCHGSTTRRVESHRTVFQHDRLELAMGDWRVIVDGVPHLDQLERQLDATQGAAITHTAQLARHDGQAFSVNECLEALDVFRQFLLILRASHADAIPPVESMRKEGEGLERLWYSPLQKCALTMLISRLSEVKPQRRFTDNQFNHFEGLRAV